MFAISKLPSVLLRAYYNIIDCIPYVVPFIPLTYWSTLFFSPFFFLLVWGLVCSSAGGSRGHWFESFLFLFYNAGIYSRKCLCATFSASCKVSVCCVFVRSHLKAFLQFPLRFLFWTIYCLQGGCLISTFVDFPRFVLSSCCTFTPFL